MSEWMGEYVVSGAWAALPGNMSGSGEFLSVGRNRDVIESLASEIHDVWAERISHMLQSGLYGKSDLVERLKSKMARTYEELSEDEKESDREIARRYLGVVSDIGNHVTIGDYHD